MDSSSETEKNTTNSSSDSLSTSNSDTEASKNESTEQAQNDDYEVKDIHVNMAKVTNVTQNKAMSYFGANAQAVTRADVNALKSKYDKYAEERHFSSAPPGYYDYIIYPHRKDAYDMADPTKILYSHSDGEVNHITNGNDYSTGDINRVFRIGDFFAVIPPEFINVYTKSTDKSIQPIRQSGSIKIENGHSKKDIQISLILNGINQINGYKVNGPMDYKYYVDGLRNLIAQMKFTPFMPIENTVINIVHDVSNVAIRNIYVETIPGFPESLQAVLTLDEFNVTPYLRIPNALFDNSIDWDLFRWYTQKALIDSDDEKFKEKLHPVKTSELTSNFKFSILKEEKIDDDNYENIYDESNYEEFISSDDDITLIKMSFNMGTIMPGIQMQDHEGPTLQFLGATDTDYTFSFQTCDSYIAGKFNELNSRNKEIIRNYRYKNGLGFLRIENELVQLTGIYCVVIKDIKVDTVPEFPDLYNIIVTCTSYDSNQMNAESLIGMRPFKDNRKGTREDLISMQPNGYLNKVSQDATIMGRFQELELYPDMHLPTYSQADEALSKIIAFRKKNNLIEMPMYTRYPRHKSILPDSTEEKEYEGFLDPDFYVMSLVANSDIKINDNDKLNSNGISKSISSGGISDLISNIDNIMDLFVIPKITPDAATEPEYAYGYEPGKTRSHHGFLYEWENKGEEQVKNNQAQDMVMSTGTSIQGSGVYMPTQVNKKSGNVLIDLLCDRVDAGCGYKQAWRQGKIVNGRQYFDCSSFVSYGLMAIGALPEGSWLVTGGLESVGVEAPKYQLQPGDILIHHGTGNEGHAALYIGNGQTAEAATSESEPNVKYGTLERSYHPYNIFRRIPNLKELSDNFLKSHPNFYGDSSISSSTSTTSTVKMNVNGTPVGLKVDQNVIDSVKAANTASAGKAVTMSESTDFANQDLCLKTQVTVEAIEQFIKYKVQSNGKSSIMIGLGSTFIEASNKSGLDVAYLVSHAGIESGWGTSEIVKDKYNWFGIGAFDSSPYKSAYNYSKAADGVIQGAMWIREKYYNNGQTTLTLFNDRQRFPTHCYNTTASFPNDCAGIIKEFHRFTNAWTANSSGSLSANSDSVTIDTTNPYNYTPEMFKNLNSGTKHGDKLSTIDTSKFGTDFMEKVLDYDSGKFDYSKVGESIKQENDENHVVEHMYRDSIQYNLNGLLARAFPSYLLVFLDEQPDWVDRKKLWTNYYVSRAAVDINIHESDDNPISVAQVSMTNFNENLSSNKKSYAISQVAFDDDDWIRENLFKLTGTIFDEEISDKMIELKNVLHDEIALSEGARVHIRLGYGSDPSRYPTCFNGTIAEVNSGEIVTFVAQSDGCELMNQPLTDKTEDTNKDLKLGAEVSNIMANLLVSRESGLLYKFSKGFFKYKSKYGIEHFGMHIHESDELSVGSALVSIGKLITFPAAALIDIADENMYYRQYDIVKNIYKGTYEGIPFCKEPYNMWDGEYNFRFLCDGKTPWDVMKMCEKAIPEFVSYPRYFGFESRMFYGLPIWLCKYDYVMGSDGIYEKAKSFAQIHEITSLDSIIKNDIKTNSKNHNTNFIGIYSLGGDLSSTPVVMSDRNIDWSKQSTKVVDTSSIQDFSWVPGIIDKLLSWTGMYDNGKQLAINVCVSELMKSWENTYDGNIVVLGKPEIRAYDYIYMDDQYLSMSGPITVRAVTHSLNIESGFTTTITPGLIANNTLKKSGISNVMSTALSISKGITHFAAIINASALVFSKGKHGIKFTKLANMFLKKKNFINGEGKAIYELLKTTKIITNSTKFLEEVNTVKKSLSVLKGVKEVGTILSTSETALTAASATFPPALIVTIALDILINITLTWVYDMFAYRNCINVMPVYKIDKDGEGKPLCVCLMGQKTLLPGAPVSDEDDK